MKIITEALNLATGLLGLAGAGLYCLFLLRQVFPSAYDALLAELRAEWEWLTGVGERRAWEREWSALMAAA